MTRRWRRRQRRLRAVVGISAATVLAGTLPAAADHATGHRAPTGPAPVEFADDFHPPLDAEYGWELGGFGGTRRGAPVSRTPIVFVHGNQADAQNWYVVRDQLVAEYGYTHQELWALSYGGLGYVGGSAPATNDGGESAYAAEHPQVLLYGNPQDNEGNVPDLLAFEAAVREYTGADRVHLVGHSLGVTIIRRAMRVDPSLPHRVPAVVAIAGANHGTTVCTGLEDDYYGCDELAPGSAWLHELNAAGEGLPPTRWMTVYDGSGAGDVFFGPTEADSPRLALAEVNATYPNTSHNDLRVDPAIVRDYADFLQQVDADAADAERTVPQPAPSPTDPPLPTTGGGLAWPAVALLALVATRRGRSRHLPVRRG